MANINIKNLALLFLGFISLLFLFKVWALLFIPMILMIFILNKTSDEDSNLSKKTIVLLISLFLFSITGLIPNSLFWISGLITIYLLFIKNRAGWSQSVQTQFNSAYSLFLCYGAFLLGLELLIVFLLADYVLSITKKYKDISKIQPKMIYAIYAIMAFIAGGWCISKFSLFEGCAISLLMIAMLLLASSPKKLEA